MKSFNYFLSIFLTFQFGILGLLKLPLKENTLLVENWKVNVVYLVQYPRIELLPNFSIKCLLIESWLKIKNIQFYN
uniref:Candidate secreted effector n=1 Tax=Meloidogyne incognita TaxID=6306 RepID=A0A914MML5_MELIC